MRPRSAAARAPLQRGPTASNLPLDTSRLRSARARAVVNPHDLSALRIRDRVRIGGHEHRAARNSDAGIAGRSTVPVLVHDATAAAAAAMAASRPRIGWRRRRSLRSNPKRATVHLSVSGPCGSSAFVRARALDSWPALRYLHSIRKAGGQSEASCTSEKLIAWALRVARRPPRARGRRAAPPCRVARVRPPSLAAS